MQLLKQYIAREGVTQAEAFKRAYAKHLKRKLSYDEWVEMERVSLNFGRADPAPAYLTDFLIQWRRSIFVSPV